MSLAVDYSLAEVAQALGMSERWVRNQIKIGAEHQRYGHKIRFTAAQVDKLRREFTTVDSGSKQSVTTGKKRKAS